jgi:hypothetical protein
VTDDASATFRGFRHQALYILSRILADDASAEQSYRPEGSEDLAVYDRAGNLIEAIQVKDYSSPLALSNLKNSFWQRFWQRRQEVPNCRTKLATFSELGPELDGAIRGDTAPRDRVVAKLRKAKSPVSQSSAVEMLDELHGNVLRPDASKLKERVHEAIRNTSIGGDVEVAAELLMYWVFEASENCTLITRNDLLLKLQEIGEYLAALRDTSQEWGRSIIPIKALTLTEESRNRWITDFRKGVHARWEHILADADSVRTSRVAEIHRSFQQSRIVIIRGASGQGKSALGWRYIHDYSAEGARFLIRHVDGPSHALTIANALGDHARKLKLRGVVYIDVSPSDLSWSRLASELASVGMKVLVTVREEDFRRERISR